MKLLLAPIQGMTNADYREKYHTIFGGFDEYYSPFISTTVKDAMSKKLFKDLFPENNQLGLEVIPQLLGCNGEHFVDYANYIRDLGYHEVNWNIGCPYHTVTKKLKGSGILPHPEKVRDFLEIVCKEKTYDLSVKMRLGLEDKAEGVEIINILNDYPIKEVIIHGRVGKQKYTGQVDLEAFNELYQLSKHEVVYNGDIFTTNDFNRIQKMFPGIQQFMLGRGALRNPFLASEIKGCILTKDEKIDKMLQFHDEMFAYYQEKLSGDKHLCDRMKEFWNYLGTHLDPDGKGLKKIRKSKSSREYLLAVNGIFSKRIWEENL